MPSNIPIPAEIWRKRDVLFDSLGQIRWCNDLRLLDENTPEAAPGGYLNRFGWYVVGTTVAGNAIVVSDHEPRVCFADHTWYSDDGIHYQDLAGDGAWHELRLTSAGVATSLFELAASVEAFIEQLPAIERTLDRID